MDISLPLQDYLCIQLHITTHNGKYRFSTTTDYGLGCNWPLDATEVFDKFALEDQRVPKYRPVPQDSLPGGTPMQEQVFSWEGNIDKEDPAKVINKFEEFSNSQHTVELLWGLQSQATRRGDSWTAGHLPYHPPKMWLSKRPSRQQKIQSIIQCYKKYDIKHYAWEQPLTLTY